MGRRIISITFAACFCLLAAHPAFAGAIDFQTAVASGGGQSGAQTAQGGSGTPAGQVQTVDLGDVTGTVCDCGEIAPAGPPGSAAKEGFPKFPLLAIAAFPGACLTGLCSPPPPLPPPPTPEPLTIITLASGLAALAGLHKRRA
jgi:hypothetical protein